MINSLSENKYIPRQKNKIWLLFTLCIASPIFTSIIRKLIPNNPPYLEASSIIVITIIGFWSLVRGRILPGWISIPLIIWVIIQLIYFILSINYDVRIGLAAIGTRILPIFMAQIAYVSIRDAKELELATSRLIIFAIPLSVISIWVAIFSDRALPLILRPPMRIENAGISLIKGYFYSASSVFSDPTELGYFGLVATVFAIAISLIYSSQKRIPLKFALVIITGTIIVYLSGRRSLLLQLVLCFMVFIILRKRLFLLMIGTLIIYLTIQWIDINSIVYSNILIRRSHFVFMPDRKDMTFWDSIENRFGNVFIENTIYHIRKSKTGKFLGSYGQEAIAFGYLDWYMGNKDTFIETGSVLLAAEMGVVGLFLMPLIIFLIAYRIIKKAKFSRYNKTLYILILLYILIFVNFFTKGHTHLTTNQLQAYVFWAVPGICASLIHFN